MNPPEELPDDLVWEGDHLSDVAMTALADGQSALVPTHAKEHVAECVACTHAVGAAALLSSHAGAVLSAHASLSEAALAADLAPRSAPVPVAGILVALALGGLGAVPALANTPLALAEASHFVLRTFPQILHGSLAVLRSSSDLLPLVSVVASVVLVVAGVAVARMMPSRFAT